MLMYTTMLQNALLILSVGRLVRKGFDRVIENPAYFCAEGIDIYYLNGRGQSNLNCDPC